MKKIVSQAPLSYKLKFSWKPQSVIRFDKAKFPNLTAASAAGTGVGSNPNSSFNNYSVLDHEKLHAKDFTSLWNSYMAPKLNASTNKKYNSECECKKAADILGRQLYAVSAKEQAKASQRHKQLDTYSKLSENYWKKRAEAYEKHAEELEKRICN